MSVVSVLTPTIVERSKFLGECERSVSCQTYDFVEHVVMLDENRDGNSVTTNRCAIHAKGEWFLPLADDDLLLPGGVEALMAATDGADIVYAPPLVTGNEDRWWFFQEPPCIPAPALIRADLWRELGGYDVNLKYEEDRDMWTKALDSGATFVRVDEPVWVYRMHAGNKSFNKVAA